MTEDIAQSLDELSDGVAILDRIARNDMPGQRASAVLAAEFVADFIRGDDRV